MFQDVYITQTSNYLPNSPVLNDEMETYLGYINNKPSKSRNIVLRNNGIKTRYYALDQKGNPTHTNSQMVSLAVRELFKNDNITLQDLDLLCCGTSTPDQIMPSHAVMVHGWLPETRSIEVVSNSGVCCSGMHALKYAWMSIKTGQAQNAVATGSERASSLMRSSFFKAETDKKIAEAESNPYISFEKDFLRWMLSDGAGAFLLQNKKSEIGLSLKIEFLDSISYANKIDTCMYCAADKLENGTLKSYMDYTSEELVNETVFSIKQDVKLLSQHIIELGVAHLIKIFEKYSLSADQIDYFLPHISSLFFQSKMNSLMQEQGIDFGPEKWFTNLPTVGNVGSGAIYVIVDELFKSGKLKKGQKIFLAVPESSRFSYVYGLLTVC